MNNDINEKIVHAAPVPPFVRFVASAVPMVFDNSLSYYECLCALWKWMQDNLVDVINNNATVTEHYIDLDLETRALFNQLKTYVDTYFDNLDVQDEINNKLDAMAEAGTLQEIITAYIQSNVAWCFDTVADMKAATNLVNGSYAQTLGFHTINDGGGALYKITDTGTANEMDVIAVGDLYANLVITGAVYPEQFGAYGDGTHNDTDAIQAAMQTGKVVEFSNKTYLCFDLQHAPDSTFKLIMHGNGATLKRPNLSIEPYNYSVEQMKWVITLRLYSDAEVRDFTFDNNCFTMWQVSDGYAQEQSCSIIARNNDKVLDITIENCTFKNSAGDGLHIVNNINANIKNCRSIDCFRGGFTSTGYGSEINLDGWISEVKTTGVNDGIDVEVDSNSVLNPEKYILNLSNFIMDYDLDIMCPETGLININNLIMREYDQDTLGGHSLKSNGGTINVVNSVLRGGKLGTVQTFLHKDGKLFFTNCKFIGNSTEAFFKFTNYQESTYDAKVYIDNCEAKCYNFITTGTIYGSLSINNCNIECANSLIVEREGNTVQALGGMFIQNSRIKFGDTFMEFGKTSGQPAGWSKLYLSNLHLEGNSGSNIKIAGSPDIYYNNLIMESGVKTTITGGGSPRFFGNARVIMVDTASNLNFAGWVAGNDIAIAKDTKARYQYTSGTTWTAI